MLTILVMEKFLKSTNFNPSIRSLLKNFLHLLTVLFQKDYSSIFEMNEVNVDKAYVAQEREKRRPCRHVQCLTQLRRCWPMLGP